MVTSVTIQTSGQRANGARGRHVAGNEQLRLLNVTREVTLQGAHGPVVFAVHIYRKNRQGQSVEHPLTPELVQRIEGAVRAQGLTGQEVDLTQSIKLNFSRTRRDDAEPPFNLARFSRKELGNHNEIDIRGNAAFTASITHPDGVIAHLTRSENQHLQSLRNAPGQGQARPGNGQQPPHVPPNGQGDDEPSGEVSRGRGRERGSRGGSARRRSHTPRVSPRRDEPANGSGKIDIHVATPEEQAEYERQRNASQADGARVAGRLREAPRAANTSRESVAAQRFEAGMGVGDLGVNPQVEENGDALP